MGNYFANRRPTGAAVRDINDILWDYDLCTGWADDNANAHQVIAECNFFIPGNIVPANSPYVVSKDGTLTTTAVAQGNPFQMWYLDAANYNITGKSLGIGSKVCSAGNSVAQAGSPGFQGSIQYNSVSFGINAGGLTVFLGPTFGGSIASPGAGQIDEELFGGFPSAGFYAPLVYCFNSEAGAAITVNLQLFTYKI
jgi:hypothetical protein